MPEQRLRREVLRDARRLVVKVGSQLVTRDAAGGPTIDGRYIGRVAGQLAKLHGGGRRVVLVCSGAVAAGCAELGLTRRPTDVADLQAVAAVGQRRLMTHVHDALRRRGLAAGQVLLTRGDFDDRLRFLNIRNCIARLQDMDVVPVLNENDTVAVDELRFGDNDRLAALTATAIRAEALVLLTGVDGLLDDSGTVVPVVTDVAGCLDMVKAGGSAWGTGGMRSKLEAARLVTDAGELAVIANGREPDVLGRLLSGEALGTLLAPAERKVDSRRRWIGFAARPAGTLTVDDGAARAITQRGKSLLATGVTRVVGRFERGDVLLVHDPAGRELARGLTNYASDELQQIKGQRSDRFETILGRPGYAAVIHRDNLVQREP
jgi:glutamate 5-kinase